MVDADITPARALARFMVAALAAMLVTLILAVGAIGIADPTVSGATAEAPAAAAP